MPRAVPPLLLLATLAPRGLTAVGLTTHCPTPAQVTCQCPYKSVNCFCDATNSDGIPFWGPGVADFRGGAFASARIGRATNQSYSVLGCVYMSNQAELMLQNSSALPLPAPGWINCSFPSGASAGDPTRCTAGDAHECPVVCAVAPGYPSRA